MADGVDAIVIDDLAALKALADPLRHRMIELLERPRSVKELAERVGRPPDRLYYHLALLERHGIVRAIEARGSERRYQAASSIAIDPGLNVPATEVAGIVTGLLETVAREYAAAGQRRGEDGVKRSMLGLRHVRLSEAERAALTAQLIEMVEERTHDIDEDDGREPFGVVVGIWPVVEE